MADDKKNISEAVLPAEAPAPAVESAAVPEPLASGENDHASAAEAKKKMTISLRLEKWPFAC